MTNPLPPRGPHERDDLLPGEAELKLLYGKLPQNEPGPALDAAVLRAAAEAVSSKHDVTSAKNPTAKKARNRPPRWLIGLSSAATLVLAAGLAWHMRSMPRTDNLPPVTEAVTTKAVSNPAADASRTSAPATMIAPVAMPPPMPMRQPPPPRMLKVARSAQSMKASVGRSKVQSNRGQVSADMPPPVAAEATQSSGESAPGHVPVELEARSAADRIAAPPPRIQQQVMRPAPLPRNKAAPEPQLSMPPAAPAPAPLSPPAPPATPQQTMPTALTTQANALEADVSPAQAAELDAIRQLFAEHHEEDAQRRLATFRRLHPQQLLPADLQARLTKP